MQNNKYIAQGIIAGLIVAILIVGGTYLAAQYLQSVKASGYQICVNDIVNNVNTTGSVKIPVKDSEGKTGYYLLAPVPEKNITEDGKGTNE